MLPIRIIENARSYGSGKLDKINTINFTGESIRYKLIYIVLADQVLALDAIEVSTEDFEDIEDTPAVTDELEASLTVVFDDQTSTSDTLVVQAGFNKTLTETVQAADVVTSSMAVRLADSVNVFDDIFISYEPCFGACGFGGTDGPDCTIPFGAKTILSAEPGSTTGLVDEILITAEFNLELEDNITALDEILLQNKLDDSIGFDEELIFNSCFGCPVDGATGFGLNNFGR